VLWILAKKVETIRKNRKHNNLLKNKRKLNIKRSAEDGLDFAFSLPGGGLPPCTPSQFHHCLQWRLVAGMRWHLHCRRTRFTGLVSCSGDLAVHSLPLLCLQGQVAKNAKGLFYCWSLLRNNKIAIILPVFISSYDIRHFDACDCWTQTS